ncbi:MAG: TonB-dependent receptor [Bacteroidales bacterium]|nr:TonB-dependent receptor [Bacteroidales bacterium]
MLLSFAGFSFQRLWAQEDTLAKRLEEVMVAAPRETVEPAPTAITHAQTRIMPLVQASDALKFFSGILVKDYGGAGGLKTVAVHGFGSQHTGVMLDNLCLADFQTGQIDFGKYTLDNLSELSVQNNGLTDLFQPARAYACANLVNMQTLSPHFSHIQQVKANVGLQAGSFGAFKTKLLLQNKIYTSRKNPHQTLYTSLYADYQNSKGNYPFKVYYGENDDSTSNEKRQNADLQSINVDFNIYACFKDTSKLHAKFYYYYSQRGLPGAVIWYNPAGKERLWDEHVFAQGHYTKYFNKSWAYKAAAKYNRAFQRYLDPLYLNAEHELNHRYVQQEGYITQTARYQSPKHPFECSVAHDLVYQNMHANLIDFVPPERWTVYTDFAASYKIRWLKFSGNLLYTYVQEARPAIEEKRNRHKLSPALSLLLKPAAHLNLKLWLSYKNIFRLPTFNDLYYREIGNTNLKPEDTHQLHVGMEYGHKVASPSMTLKASANAFYNKVENKIVAIPGKNLFLWSMMNFGKVEIWGADLTFAGQYRITRQIILDMLATYTFSRAMDIADKQSKTYRHQVPYIPFHAASGFVLLQTPWIEYSYTLILSGKRYALPQNNNENLLAPYIDHGMAVGHTFRFKRCALGIKGEVLNLANKHYEVARNYPMPGRNYRVTINVEFD